MHKNLILYAFLLLVLGNLFATFVDVLVKIYAQPGAIYQYLLIRQLVLLALILPFWLKQNKPARAPGNIKVHASRALLSTFGAGGAVFALLYLPLATANVLFYAAPIITMLLAAYLLKEPIKKHRIIAMVVGFIGIAIAMRPQYINFAALAALVTAFCIAGFNLSVRWLPKDISIVSTMFWTNIICLPITAVIALTQWQAIDQDMLILAVSSCICLLVYQGCCIVAFKHADAGAIAIAEYSGLVFAALLGWGIFAEYLDNYTLLGIALIILPIAWQSLKEHKLEKQLKAEQLTDSSPPHPNFLAQTATQQERD